MLVSPRLEGILEQFERAKLFLAEAQKSRDRVDRFRRLVASVYFSRAIVELMLDAADDKEVKEGRKELEGILVGKLPFYMIIERLRIHDFHRFGLIERPGITIQGPYKFKTGLKDNALAAIRTTPRGVKKITTGGSEVIEERPLILKGDQVFDEERGEFVPIEQVLSAYLKAVPEALEQFKKLLKG
jgi:hypothetical protein